MPITKTNITSSLILKVLKEYEGKNSIIARFSALSLLTKESDSLAYRDLINSEAVSDLQRGFLVTKNDSARRTYNVNHHASANDTEVQYSHTIALQLEKTFNEQCKEIKADSLCAKMKMMVTHFREQQDQNKASYEKKCQQWGDEDWWTPHEAPTQFKL